MNEPTANQKKAISSTGNLLIVAGAGAGKTRTLVQRCVSFLLDETTPGSLDEILMVTFTEAASAEMRQRIRHALEEKLLRAPENSHLAEQLALLDSARICTLHSFCYRLIRDSFYDLGLDPQINVLPDEQGQLLAREVLDGLMKEIYDGEIEMAAPVQRLISEQGRGWDKPIRDLVKRVHAYQQTLPDPEGWFADQLARFAPSEPGLWERWFREELNRWKNWWLPVLRSQDAENVVAHTCARLLAGLPAEPDRNAAAAAFTEILASETLWPAGKKGKFKEPIKDIFDDANFLNSLCLDREGIDPLTQDWAWAKPQILALLQLAKAFSERFGKAKRESASLDFHDLEQFALDLLWDRKARKPTPAAESWQQQLRLVLVDEYQDINEAQDTILKALARPADKANRFLVGDVKQSIYRFRLANPRIFLDYEERWKAAPFCQVIPLSDNFRSHEAILNFVNPLFAALMKKEIGGVDYDDAARLGFGNRDGRSHLTVAKDPVLRVELHLRTTGQTDEPANAGLDALSSTEKEARLIGLRLLELKKQGCAVWKEREQRPVQWGDMVILLRSPRNKTEAFAKVFDRLGIPLTTTRGGFYESLEVSDILHLLRLLDNPLQDLPLLAVLRSPFVGLSLDEFAEIRVAHRQGQFWTALLRWHELNAKARPVAKLFLKVDRFIHQWELWRRLKKQVSLSQVVETILDETHYPDWLMAQNRGSQRCANIERLLDLTRQFDSLQGQGLFRFIRFVEAQEDAEIDLEPASADAGDAVRLMSIHQSKGLEFPVVVVADLGKTFNFADTKEKVILDEVFGVCPQVIPPGTRQAYPSLPYWLAQRRQRTETLGEEMRLLYVATTRAVDRLILSGSAGTKVITEKWPALAERGLDVQEIASAKNYLDWLGPWLAQTGCDLSTTGANSLLGWTVYSDSDARISTSNEMETKATPLATEVVSPEILRELQARITWRYGFQSSTLEPAKTSVSALRRRADLLDDEAQPLPAFRQKSKTRIPSGKLTAAQIGTAHHTFLEFVSLEKVGSEAELKSEAERICQSGIIGPDEIAVLDFAALAAFWNSTVGRKVLEKRACLRREHPFTSRLKANEPAKSSDPKHEIVSSEEFVVLQGVIDLAVILPDEIWLLDFKSDQIKKSELDERARHYRTQVLLYAEALGKIYGRPVTERWLHFLAIRETVSVPAN